MNFRKKNALNNVTDNRSYNIIYKNTDQYCYICCRRSGRYGAYCGPSNFGKQRRSYRTWKYNRKTKWK